MRARATQPARSCIAAADLILLGFVQVVAPSITQYERQKATPKRYVAVRIKRSRHPIHHGRGRRIRCTPLSVLVDAVRNGDVFELAPIQGRTQLFRDKQSSNESAHFGSRKRDIYIYVSASNFDGTELSFSGKGSSSHLPDKAEKMPSLATLAEVDHPCSVNETFAGEEKNLRRVGPCSPLVSVRCPVAPWREPGGTLLAVIDQALQKLGPRNDILAPTHSIMACTWCI